MERCETLSVAEAARVLGVGRTRFYEAIRQGVVPVLRVGRKCRVPRTIVEQLLEDPARFAPVAEGKEA